MTDLPELKISLRKLEQQNRDARFAIVFVSRRANAEVGKSGRVTVGFRMRRFSYAGSDIISMLDKRE